VSACEQCHGKFMRIYIYISYLFSLLKVQLSEEDYIEAAAIDISADDRLQ
jgi:hypothetical protein